MGFESPGWLWGALAALIPLVLHMIMRRRARVHEFAAIEFILLSNKKIARRLKLKQWLLLMLRMLLLAALPFAFAKPFLVADAESVAVGGGSTPTSVVLVLDPSFSMGLVNERQTLAERARERALDILDDLGPESDAAIVVASSPARALTPRLSYDRARLKEAVESVQVGWGTADLSGALRLAEQILVASGQPRREVVLLTDLQATEWQGLGRPWSLDHAPRVTLLDVRAGKEAGNVAITGAFAEPDPTGSGRDVKISVDVLNDRPTTFEDVVTVRIGGKTAKGIVRIPPRSATRKEFSIRLARAGPSTGVVELPPDELPGDNTQPFVIDFMRRVQVLVVNGSPRTVPHRDETFFLRPALRPGREAGSRMSPTYLKPDELTEAQLAFVDVVVLANVTELAPDKVTALLQWVHGGGGLLLTSGENVTQDTYNGPLRPLLPLPLRDIRDTTDKPVFFTGVDTGHPALALFDSMPDASLFTAGIRRYILLDTAAEAGTRVLMSYTDGAPALVERTMGSGRVAFLTTTIDRDWNDLPFETSYLPLVQHLVLHLGGRLEESARSTLVVGESHRINVGRDVLAIEVTGPDGSQTRFEGADLASGDVRFHETGQRGIYTVRQIRSQGAEEERFAVQVDVRESTLAAADRAEVERLLTAGEADGAEVARALEAAPAERSGNLWPTVLLSLFVILGAETWLAWQSA
ncbi:MAG: hypothetical protein ACI9WU_003595 [Myxococcota bacterium]|jgi:hypothetical protein